MSTTTTNYGLIKPDTTDPILIGQLNDNSDAIDAALKENADAIENKPDAADIPSPSTAAPAMDGTAAAGTSTDYARADHVHPSDTSKQDALTTAQLAAANSGINSEKVAQYDSTTELEAEDRAALVELVDGGAKNIASANTLSASIGGVTCTQDANDKNIISLAGTNTSAITAYIWGSLSSPLNITVNEDYYIAAAERSTNISFAMSYVDSGGTTQFITIPSTGYVIPTGSTICNVYVQQNATNKTIDFSVKLMVCSKVAWDISQAYQPYRPSYQELYDMVKTLQPAT